MRPAALAKSRLGIPQLSAFRIECFRDMGRGAGKFIHGLMPARGQGV